MSFKIAIDGDLRTLRGKSESIALAQQRPISISL